MTATRSARPFPLAALVACAAFVAAPVLASSSAVLGYDDARHLLARTGFGPTDAEVRIYASLTRADAVDKLLRETRTSALTRPPAFALDRSPLRYPRGDTVSEAERKTFRQQQVREGLELRGWWVEEMLVTPSPLTERMTLFWHNHFVSAQPKVRFTRLMYDQNVTLRANALGNFGTLLHAISKDPAMVLYLDSVQNRKAAPNENFAREVMELFTLGEGRYTETDIKESARAFTGWSLDRDSGTFMFRRFIHDDATKTVFGKSGNFDGDQVLDLILARPEVATFVTEKLWREFVSPDLDAEEVNRIARRFRESNFDIKVALREILTSEAFYARENRGVLVKSPIELVVGTLHQLELAPADALPFAIASAAMGQNLMSAPNVKGWPGGESWINTTTLLARKQFRERLTRGDDSFAMSPVAMAVAANRQSTGSIEGAPAAAPSIAAEDDEKARQRRFARQMERGITSLNFDSARWMAELSGATPDQRARSAERLLLAVAPQQRPDYGADSSTVVRGLILDAAYELK